MSSYETVFCAFQAVIHLETIQPQPKRIDYLDSLVEKVIVPNSDSTDIASTTDKEEISCIFMEVILHKTKAVYCRLVPFLLMKTINILHFLGSYCLPISYFSCGLLCVLVEILMLHLFWFPLPIRIVAAFTSMIILSSILCKMLPFPLQLIFSCLCI